MTLRVLIADDHALVRSGFAALISDFAGVQVVGEAGDGIVALRLAQELSPDLVLLDINMPRMGGLECLSELLHVQPWARVLILSMHANAEHVRTAMERGAKGYLLKDARADDLELAIRTVGLGHTWLSGEAAAVLRASDGSARGRAEDLSPRQRLVLKRLAEGATVKEIAFDLGLSIKTIETYRAQIMEKLAISDLPGLVRYAIRTGITSL